MVRDGDKYRVIFCKIRKKYKAQFEKALEELENKMNESNELHSNNAFSHIEENIINIKEDSKNKK